MGFFWRSICRIHASRGDVVEFGFPTTPAKELAMDCVGVRAKGVNANGLILAIDLGKFKNVAEETIQSLGVSRHDSLG
jgi:hypothetical protein